MKVGDRVRHKYPPQIEGEVIRTSNYPDNPYNVMVRDNGGVIHNFKPEHLELVSDASKGE